MEMQKMCNIFFYAIRQCNPPYERTRRGGSNFRKRENDLVWKVQNQGEEIPEAEREKIFERFYRVDKARNRKEKRYGLGLAIAKSTIEKYAGKITVDCINGKTIFQVKIPEKG